MSDFIGIDVSEINHLAADLAGAGVRSALAVVPVLTKAGSKMTTEARELAPQGPRTRAYPSSINYDVEISHGMIAVEVGPDKDLPQGPLGNLLEYGTSKTPPHPHLQPAFEHEQPKIDEYITAALTGASHV